MCEKVGDCAGVVLKAGSGLCHCVEECHCVCFGVVEAMLYQWHCLWTSVVSQNFLENGRP